MAVLPDYLNLSLLLRISNKQQTDIEYELPDDVRQWSDFQLPAGYTMIRGTLVGGAAATVLSVPVANVLVFVQTSGNTLFALNGASGPATFQGRMFLFSAGADRTTAIVGLSLTSQEAAGVVTEYTYITLPT